ncbi:MAG TPA: MmcQ/YjbR family DNA-binding protein [Terriglobales bacterium]|jgi:predicted DNA-binding protein (MmcQ/YjbR family)|nr:MmcQ/YjbR family DNA-binding protein [Terriglobales bacterium]
MNLDSIRKRCLSFPGATERLQWEDELCFKVRGKIFAMVSLSSVPQRLIFKCDPEQFLELIENEGVVPAPYVGRYKWVMMEDLKALSGSEIDRCLRKSYTMVASKVRPKIKKTKRTRKPRNS